MLAPRPFAESQVARLSEDPWSAVRRIVAGARYEALGELPGASAALPPGKRRQPVEGFSYGAFLQPSEGYLYAAFISLAAGNDGKAATIFSLVLEHLPRLAASHEFWVSLSALAAISNAQGAALFDAFLERQQFRNKEFLGRLPLPARNNFLSYCIRHQKLDLAVELVEDAGADWQPNQLGLEAWAFRLTALDVLHRARRDEQFDQHAEAYQKLMRSAGVDPATERPVIEFMLALRLGDATADRGDSSAALSNYRKGLEIAERPETTVVSGAVLSDLLLKTGRFCQALGNLAEAETFYRRCVAAATLNGCRNELAAALDGLARLLGRDGNHADLAMLYTRRVLLTKPPPQELADAGQAVRYQLACAFLGGEGRAIGWRMLGAVIKYARDAGPAADSLLVSSLLTRLAVANHQELDDEDFWNGVKEVVAKPDLTSAQFRELTKSIAQAIGNGRNLPPSRDALTRIAEAACRLQDGASSDGALALLTLARTVLQSDETSSVAIWLMQRAGDAASALGRNTSAYRAWRQQLLETRSTLLQRNLAQKPDEELVAHWQLYFADADGFSIEDWNAALVVTENLFEGRSAIAAGARGLLELALDPLKMALCDRQNAERLIALVDVAYRFCDLMPRYLNGRGDMLAAALARQALDALAASNGPGEEIADLVAGLRQIQFQAEPGFATALGNG